MGEGDSTTRGTDPAPPNAPAWRELAREAFAASAAIVLVGVLGGFRQ